ncbi:uncharacterized protein V1516DRAFT_662892 [Lipomyces oligophaga]|uniref:uncharacterized protein n=1 Tax=Lipomyces oligophaga TaxID=45792 RepID=UPI0034CF0C3A
MSSTSPAVTEFESLLTSMLDLRPPGVSGSKIRRLSEIVLQNVQFESVLIQKLYTHFKKAPANYKLGALYVVDAVVRVYQEEARKLGEVPSANSKEGTPAAAVYHISDIIDSLIADIATAPAEQKDKILKVIDIWERSATFSPEILASLRARFNGSTTPPHPPPSYLFAEKKDNAAASAGVSTSAQSSAPPASASSILEALANIAKQPGGASSAAQPPPPPPLKEQPRSSPNVSTPTLSNLLASVSNGSNGSTSGSSQYQTPKSEPTPNLSSLLGMVQQNSAPMPAPPKSSAPDLSSILSLMTAGQQNPATPYSQPPAPPAQGLSGIQGLTGFGQPAGGNGNSMEQQLALMQFFLSQGVPVNQLATLLQAAGGLNGGTPGGAVAAVAPVQPPAPAWTPYEETRGRNDGYGNGSRERSRSPRGGRRRSRSPSFRERSPGRRGRAESPTRYGHSVPDRRPKQVSVDPSIPAGCVRVLSRTLFVGGVPQTMSDERLISIFEQRVPVQSVIMNKDKRCAFLKVYYRSDAELLKSTMETYQESDFTLRCRWGVGFGPRDCCEYSSGVSTIPIDRLTDADKRWITTAEYGGTGGRPLEAKLIIEEPDIEIGAGVSSKAISRRMPTNQGGDMGPKSSLPEFRGGSGSGGRRYR